MASGFYSGAFADAVLVHPLDTKDGDDVGPGAWTLKDGATIETANAKFGKNLKCDTGPKRMDSDSAIVGFDDSDGKKVLYFLFWTADTLGFNRTIGGITNSANSKNRTRILFDVTGARMRLDWTRKTDLGGAGTSFLRVRSNGSLISTGQSHSLVGFIDSGSASQGKIFVDGTDETFDVVNTAQFPATVGTFQHARLGNHINGLDPGQFVDEFTIIQDDAMNDAQVALLVAQYNDTRGFGYRPKFGSLAVAA